MKSDATADVGDYTERLLREYEKASSSQFSVVSFQRESGDGRLSANYALLQTASTYLCFWSLTYSASRTMFRWRSINLVIPLLALSKDDEGTPRFAVHEALSAKEHADTSQRQYLTDHIHFIHHQRKQILLLDLSNCSPAEVRKIFQAVPEFVTVRPHTSVLILADFTGASFDAEAIRVMKEAAVFDKPYVRKCAWTGTAQALAMRVSNFSCREFPVFQTRKEALAWLAKD